LNKCSCHSQTSSLEIEQGAKNVGKRRIFIEPSEHGEWDGMRNGRTMNDIDSPMSSSKNSSSKFEVDGLGRGVRGIGGQDNISNLAFHYNQITVVRRQCLLSMGHTFTCRSKITLHWVSCIIHCQLNAGGCHQKNRHQIKIIMNNPNPAKGPYYVW
jgi:hypothetical protein